MTELPEEKKPSMSVWQMFSCAYDKMPRVHQAYPKFFLILLIQVGVDVSTPYFYKVLIDGITAAVAAHTAPSLVLWHFVSLSLLWAVISCISIGANYLYNNYLNQYMNMDWCDYLMTLSKQFLALPLSYHISTDTGEKTQILERGADAVFDVGYQIYRSIFPQVLFFVGYLCLGFFTNALMMSVILLLIPIGSYATYWIGSKTYALQKDSSQRWDKSYGRLWDAFINISIVKLFSREAYEVAYLNQLFSEAIEKQKTVWAFWIGFRVFLGGFNVVGRLGTLAVGLIMVLYGQITIGEVFMFTIISSQMLSPLGQFFDSYQSIVKSIARYSKAQEILEMGKEEIEKGETFEQIQGSLQFEDVSFCYPKTQREVISHVSFEVKKGQKVAFIGHTGAGKSTITQLLMRFYMPTSGKITIDGTDISTLSLKSYRHKLATVFQDTTLFNDTILANLQYVNENLSQEQIEEACKKAQIYDFIVSLEKGFETVVGERGLKLSGGEKQRLAIARAILADPEILILDEATSALDTHTEKSVQAAFAELMNGRTSFIVAHRLSTIRTVDTIFLMENGKIIAHGNHSELYASNEIYQEMVDGQKMV